jgi:hypothetical protein
VLKSNGIALLPGVEIVGDVLDGFGYWKEIRGRALYLWQNFFHLSNDE